MSFPINGVDTKRYFPNDVSTGKGNFWKFTKYFVLLPILLYDIIDGILCLINTDIMFTLDNVDIEEIYFWSLLEGIIKECINIFG